VARLVGEQASRTLSAALFGFPGCMLVLASAFVPLVLILTITSLQAVSPQLEEAGRLAGRWAVVLRGVTLPLAAPGIALAAMLVFLLTTGEFGVPLFLRYEVFAVESFTQFSAFLDYGAATAAALPLVAVVVLVLGLEGALVRDKTYDLRPAAGESLVISLGRWRHPALLGVVLVCVTTLLLPLGALVVRAGSVEAIRQAIGHGGPSLLRSVLYAGTGATLLTAVGFLLGYLVHHKASSVWRAVDSLTLFLFALPGTVLGIGLAAMWNRPVVGAVYATPLVMIIGYLAQYAAIPSRITLAALGRLPPTMEEAAQTVGAGWPRRLVSIVVPLVGPGLLGAWLVSFLFCLRDLGLTMLVYPAGADTLPVRTFTLMANGAPSMIAALCLLLVATALVPLAALGVVGGRLRGTS
jgi:iron(III) transport system permease protein